MRPSHINFIVQWIIRELVVHERLPEAERLLLVTAPRTPTLPWAAKVAGAVRDSRMGAM